MARLANSLEYFLGGDPSLHLVAGWFNAIYQVCVYLMGQVSALILPPHIALPGLGHSLAALGGGWQRKNATI